MSVLNKLASMQGRRDETPNQLLAKELARARDKAGIREIAENLWNKDKRIAFDCIKTLYEVGYIEPTLIRGYAREFLHLLHSRNNRMVWGAMLALSTIAELEADAIFERHADIQQALEHGSVITVDNAVKTLARVASKKDAYRRKLLPDLLKYLEICRLKSVPQYAESTVVAVDEKHKKKFIAVLEKRIESMTSSQASRIRRVIREAEKR